MEIGFIGLGNMGGPMSRRLIAAGHTLTVFDTRREAMDALIALGATAARSPADVAEQVETVMTSLPSLDIGLKVVSGDDGLMRGSRVRRYVDLSTTGSRAAIKTAEILQARNIVQIDSPVSGGVAGAEKGTLAVMVSGPRPEVEVVRPALEVFGKVFVCGDRPGLAQSMKLANNFLSATAMAATSEAIAMGVKAGLDPSTMVEVINAGSGMNTATTQKFPRSVLPGTFDYGFGMGLMVKDVRLFLAEAEDFGIPAEVAQAVGRLWEAAMAEHGAGTDFTRLAQTVERRAGIEMRAKKA
ncbi:MAG TPA: NAD(P)-dependent oxidoreductase [Xanthobacteraceae bacterium]|nr:NAD(P)-dependent oxidoreductase [Xanthobacteraceae bacterium]